MAPCNDVDGDDTLRVSDDEKLHTETEPCSNHLYIYFREKLEEHKDLTRGGQMFLLPNSISFITMEEIYQHPLI